MEEPLKPCGHRIREKHFKIIRKWARVWNVSEAQALRLMLERFHFYTTDHN